MTPPSPPPGDQPLLSMRGLTIRFGSDATHPPTVDGIDLDIRAGEFVALVGESGSGKDRKSVV